MSKGPRGAMGLSPEEKRVRVRLAGALLQRVGFPPPLPSPPCTRPSSAHSVPVPTLYSTACKSSSSPIHSPTVKATLFWASS